MEEGDGQMPNTTPGQGTTPAYNGDPRTLMSQVGPMETQVKAQQSCKTRAGLAPTPEARTDSSTSSHLCLGLPVPERLLARTAGRPLPAAPPPPVCGF